MGTALGAGPAGVWRCAVWIAGGGGGGHCFKGGLRRSQDLETLLPSWVFATGVAVGRGPKKVSTF